LDTPDSGSSAAAIAAAAAAMALLPGRWPARFLAVFFLVSLATLAFLGLDAWLAHILAIPIGAAMGYWWWRPRMAQREPRQSRIAIASSD
jgi:4-hydroxybenzoate polyprenyltransferase